MTGEGSYIEELNPYANSYVTFGDGTRGRITGISKLVSADLPCLDDVLLVEGIIANLISINKLCEQGLNVSYNKSKCILTNKDQVVLIKGLRPKENYYMWIS